jgi:hypothetical protein
MEPNADHSNRRGCRARRGIGAPRTAVSPYSSAWFAPHPLAVPHYRPGLADAGLLGGIPRSNKRESWDSSNSTAATGGNPWTHRRCASVSRVNRTKSDPHCAADLECGGLARLVGGRVLVAMRGESDRRPADDLFERGVRRIPHSPKAHQNLFLSYSLDFAIPFYRSLRSESVSAYWTVSN